VDIDIYEKFNTKLESIWLKFEENAIMTPFQSYAWLLHWQKMIGAPLQKTQLQLVILKEKDDIIAILPLCISKFRGIKILKWLGGVQSDYKAPLFHKNWTNYKIDFEVIWEKICNHLKSYDVIHLESQPEMLGMLINPFISSFNVNHNDTASHAKLSGDWMDYYNSKIKKKVRSDTRRSLRRLNELGTVSFSIANSTSESISIINKMISQKSKKYLKTGLKDILAISEYRKFYKQLPNLKYNTKMNLHCSAFKVDKTIIATHVGLVYKEKFYYLMPAYESTEWAHYSPGRLLLEKLIEWSFLSNIKLFDFTVGAESYKAKWCDKEEKIYEYLEPCNAIGYFYIIWEYIKKNIILSKIGSKYLRKLRIKVS